MKMKLNDVLVKATQLEYLARKQLPVRLSYAIGRNRDAFAKEYQRYEAERIKMCEMFADKDADGKPIVENNNYQMTDEARQELNEALEEFRNTTEVDIEIYKYTKPINTLLDELDGNSRFDALSADDLRLLSFIIDE